MQSCSSSSPYVDVQSNSQQLLNHPEVLTRKFGFGDKELHNKASKNVAPGVPVPAGQVQGRVRVDHRAVRRVLPHLGGVDNQYPGDVQKNQREKLGRSNDRTCKFWLD